MVEYLKIFYIYDIFICIYDEVVVNVIIIGVKCIRDKYFVIDWFNCDCDEICIVIVIIGKSS